jgi:hypothetical protein
VPITAPLELARQLELMLVQWPAVRKKVWPAELRTLKPSEQREPPA